MTETGCAGVASSYKGTHPIMETLPSRPHLNLITSRRLHLLTPSHRSLGLQLESFLPGIPKALYLLASNGNDTVSFQNSCVFRECPISSSSLKFSKDKACVLFAFVSLAPGFV